MNIHNIIIKLLLKYFINTLNTINDLFLISKYNILYNRSYFLIVFFY